MDIIECVTSIVKPFLDEKNYQLYKVEIGREFGYKILRVLVDKSGGIDVEDLTIINEFLSEKLDAYDFFNDEYMLEVCSPGAEKQLRNDEEINDAIGKYINVKTSDNEYEGYLEDADLEKITIKINLKGRIKEVTVKKNEIKKIRLAVKF